MKRQKRIKKSFPRRWSSQVVNVGSGLNRQVLAEYHERAKSLAIDHVYEERLNRFFGVEVGQYTFISEERQRCISNIKEISTRFDCWKPIVCFESKRLRVSMWWSGDKAFFVKEDLLLRRVQRSIQYARDRAMYYYHFGTVHYLKTQTMESEDEREDQGSN